jgi:uncharacterized phage protein gp47/JayE
MNSQGFTIKTYSEFLEEVKNELTDIYGVTNFDSNTIQGQIANNYAKTKYDAHLQFVNLYNSLSLNAEGVRLDEIASLISGVQRRGATFTTVNITITTNRALNITTDFTIADTGGNRYSPSNNASLTEGENIILFQAQDSGALTPQINTITNIITPQVGILSVNNPSTYIAVGSDVETDQVYRERIANTRAINASGGVDSLYSGLLTLDGVSEVKVYTHRMEISENIVPAHNVWCIVEGGADQEIGDMIASKNNYSSMIGDVVTLFTTQQGVVEFMRFDRPSNVSIYVRGNIKTSAAGFLDSLKTYITQNVTYAIGSDAESSLLLTIAREYLIDNNIKGTPYDFEISKNGNDWFNILSVDLLKDKFVIENNNIDITLIA